MTTHDAQQYCDCETPKPDGDGVCWLCGGVATVSDEQDAADRLAEELEAARLRASTRVPGGR